MMSTETGANLFIAMELFFHCCLAARRSWVQSLGVFQCGVCMFSYKLRAWDWGSGWWYMLSVPGDIVQKEWVMTIKVFFFSFFVTGV